MEYIVYDPMTGEIKWGGYCSPRDYDLQATEGYSVVEGSLSRVQIGMKMIVDGALVDRPFLPFFMSADSVPVDGTITISSLPEGVRVNVDGDDVTVNDHSLTLTFDCPGEYVVRMSLFPYLDKEVTITCY